MSIVLSIMKMLTITCGEVVSVASATFLGAGAAGLHIPPEAESSGPTEN